MDNRQYSDSIFNKIFEIPNIDLGKYVVHVQSSDDKIITGNLRSTNKQDPTLFFELSLEPIKNESKTNICLQISDQDFHFTFCNQKILRKCTKNNYKYATIAAVVFVALLLIPTGIIPMFDNNINSSEQLQYVTLTDTEKRLLEAQFYQSANPTASAQLYNYVISSDPNNISASFGLHQVLQEQNPGILLETQSILYIRNTDDPANPTQAIFFQNGIDDKGIIIPQKSDNMIFEYPNTITNMPLTLYPTDYVYPSFYIIDGIPTVSNALTMINSDGENLMDTESQLSSLYLKGEKGLTITDDIYSIEYINGLDKIGGPQAIYPYGIDKNTPAIIFADRLSAPLVITENNRSSNNVAMDNDDDNSLESLSFYQYEINIPKEQQNVVLASNYIVGNDDNKITINTTTTTPSYKYEFIEFSDHIPESQISKLKQNNTPVVLYLTDIEKTIQYPLGLDGPYTITDTVTPPTLSFEVNSGIVTGNYNDDNSNSNNSNLQLAQTTTSQQNQMQIDVLNVRDSLQQSSNNDENDNDNNNSNGVKLATGTSFSSTTDSATTSSTVNDSTTTSSSFTTSSNPSSTTDSSTTTTTYTNSGSSTTSSNHSSSSSTTSDSSSKSSNSDSNSDSSGTITVTSPGPKIGARSAIGTCGISQINTMQSEKIIPGDISVDGEFVYVSDPVHGIVYKILQKDLDYIGNNDFLQKQQKISHSFKYPCGLAINSDYLYVADAGNHLIYIFDKEDGSLVKSFGGLGDTPGKFDSPEGITLSNQNNDSNDSNNNVIYVADTGNNRIQTFDEYGNHLDTIGEKDNLDSPVGVTVSEDKNNNTIIYVTDTGNNRIQTFDEYGNSIKIIGESEKLVSPSCISITDSEIFVTDHLGNSVKVYDKDSRNFQFEYSGNNSNGNNSHNNTSSITLDGPFCTDIDSTSQTLYITDQNNNRISSITLEELFAKIQFDVLKCNTSKIIYHTPSPEILDKFRQLTTPQQLLDDANSFTNIGQYDEALLFYIVSSFFDSDNPNIWNGIGYAQTFVCGNEESLTEPAIESYNHVLDNLDSDNVNSLNGLGYYYYDRANSEVKMRHTSDRVYINLDDNEKSEENDDSSSYSEINTWFSQQAIFYYSKVLEIQPNNINALNGLASVYQLDDRRNVQKTQQSNSLYYYNLVLEIQPNNINALNGLGETYFKLHKLETSISYYDKVLQQDPHNPAALQGIIAAYSIHTEPLPNKYLKAYGDLKPQIIEKLLEQAESLYQSNLTLEAKIFAERILELDDTVNVAKYLS